jgi:hypothetical protein
MQTAVKSKPRIRGENLQVFRPRPAKPLKFDRILPLVDDEGRVIASNKRQDKALVGSKEWEEFKAALPCWSGTMTAYAMPGAEFGTEIECTDLLSKIRYVFPVPAEYQKVKNGILVAEHPDYSLVPEGKKRFVVNATKVDLVENFPVKVAWYLTDPVHGIPFGSEVDEKTPGARRLHRIDNAGRVGLVARGYSGLLEYGDWRNVYICYWQSDAFRVLVEAR